jgi:hypothetical protein
MTCHKCGRLFGHAAIRLLLPPMAYHWSEELQFCSTACMVTFVRSRWIEAA